MGLASELNIAVGAEYREEEFDLFAGDEASYVLGPLASQGFSSSSNGFGASHVTHPLSKTTLPITSTQKRMSPRG
ncbi:MAG: hypothetical protein CM15mP74_35210 [Halieaceae bacterium]|nr:MAG: hypothetical protein CM15mP74_35210 [Halieaceae bacterium]